MGKIITSPVKQYPGTVTIKDPFLMEDAIAWETASDAADEMRDFVRDEAGNVLSANLKEGVPLVKNQCAYIPGFMAVVEEWNLEGFDPAVFPMSPHHAVGQLIYWLVQEIRTVYYGPPNE